MNIKQPSFSAGMDLLSKDTEIDPKGYRMAFNFRNRYGYGEAIQSPQDITYNLSVAGKFQGIYAVNNIWLAFFGGQAFYMLVGGTQWFRVPNLQLDSNVDYIYIAAVPGSTSNFLRQAVTVGNAIDTNAGITNSPISVGGTPAGIVCQDGKNIPWLISYDIVNQTATARQLGTYAQWDNTGNSANNMEYVPIGLQMMYLAPVLYIQAPSKNQVYRSVSGAPLNFMVNVDTNGNKLETEALGGAATTSFAVDFDDITCLVPSTTAANAFVLATRRFIYVMQTDFTNTIFGEPTFTKAFTLEAGIVNQFSICDINGDTAFIDFEGVGFFNSVQNLKFEGRNDPLSKNISQILFGITQDICCCSTFNNYNLFALNTTVGHVIAVFNNMSKTWTSFDINDSTTSGVKMFAVATIPNQNVLAAATTNGKIFILYNPAITQRETACVFGRAFVSGEYIYGTFYPHPIKEEHKLNFLRPLLISGKQDGIMSVLALMDEQLDQSQQIDIPAISQGINFPVIPPVFPNNAKGVKSPVFTLDQGRMGYKTNPVFSWNNDLKFYGFDVDIATTASQVSQAEQEINTFKK